VIKLLIQHGANIEAADDGPRPLHQVAEVGDCVTIKTLLILGADIDVRDESQTAALHSAAGGHSNAVSALLHWREYPQDDKEQTPLHIAAKYHDFSEAYDPLIRHGTGPTVNDRQGRTASYIKSQSHGVLS
jgi:ankyrin repeat protein